MGQFTVWSPTLGAHLTTSSNDLDDLLDLWVGLDGDRPDVNPIIAEGARAAPLQPFCDSDIISRDERSKHPLWQEFYDKVDMPHVASTVLVRTSQQFRVLSCVRSRSEGFFAAPDVALIRAVAKRWQAALQMADSIRNDAENLLVGAIEVCGISAFVLDSVGQVRRLSNSAEQLLRSGGLTLRRGLLSAKGKQSELCFAVETCRQTGLPQQLVVEAEPHTLLKLTVSKLPASHTDFVFGPAMVLVCEEVKRMQGLTSAEAEVAAALLTGLDMQGIASERTTSVETVRSQAKAIYAKTGVRSQIELILTFGPRSR